ncbi:MAG: hypothetical protein KA253_06530 [Campylobacteraceae bacterium]|nr:hypothetical protein [Campylobacteraceae bacterium]NCB82684.1 hypothetical protein [Bacilli bacterium]
MNYRVKNLNKDKIISIEYTPPVRSNSKITVTYYDEHLYSREETYERKDIEDFVFIYATGYILVHYTKKDDVPEKFIVYRLKGYNVLDEPLTFGEYGLRLRKNEGMVFSSMNELKMLIELFKEDDNYEISIDMPGCSRKYIDKKRLKNLE